MAEPVDNPAETSFVRWERHVFHGNNKDDPKWEHAGGWIDGDSAYLLGERLNVPKDGMALEVFDLKQGEWITDVLLDRHMGKERPEARTGNTLVFAEVERKVYVFGGRIKATKQVNNDLLIGQLDANQKAISWTRIPGKSAEELAAMAAAAAAALVASPTKKPGKDSKAAAGKDPKKDAKPGKKGKQEPEGPPAVDAPTIQEGGWPAPRSGHASTRLCRGDENVTQVVVHGGVDDKNNLLPQSDGIWLLSTDTNTWTQVVTNAGASPLPRRNHSITCLGSNGEALAVFGGASTAGLPSNDIFILALDTWTWFKLEGLHSLPYPSPRAWHSAMAVATPRLRPPAGTAIKNHVPVAAASPAPEPEQPLRGSLRTSFRASMSNGSQGSSNTVANPGPPCPQPLWTGDQVLLVFGGVGGKGATDPDIWAMGPNGRWQVVESRGDRPSARYAHVTMQYDEGTRMAILGGADGKGARLSDLYTVDLLARAPEPLPPPPPPDPRQMTRVYENGDVYEGENVNGSREGVGTCKYADGSVYEGEWASDRMDGQGTLRLANYDVYQGSFVAGLFDGTGEYTWVQQARSQPPVHTNEHAVPQATQGPCEVTYSGQWRKGRRQGSGKATYEDGSFYDGQWYDNQPHGEGEAGWGEVRVTGTWEQGVLVKGRVLDGAKGESYDGQMQGRQRHGYGTLTYRDGSTYEGFWRLDRRNGHGLYHDAVSQERHEGKWVADQRNGRGRASYASGAKFEGTWANGVRDGQGVLKYLNGDVFTGNFARGMKNGPGTLKRRQTTTVVNGTWADDVQVAEEG